MHPSNNSGRSRLKFDVQEHAAVKQKTADGHAEIGQPDTCEQRRHRAEIAESVRRAERTAAELSCHTDLARDRGARTSAGLIPSNRDVVLQVHLAIRQVGLPTATGKRVACPVTNSSAAHCCL